MLDYLIDKAGYLGFVAFLALCGMGLPIPEEIPLVAAGWMSHEGHLEHWQLAYLSCLIGALLGDSVMYTIGRRLGHGYLMQHPFFARFIDPEREEKFEQIIKRHGFKLVLVTRFLIGVRGPVYFAAGAARVPYLRFLMWDGFAATLVVSVIFGLGYFFGTQIGELIHKAETFLTISALFAAVLAGGAWLVHKRMKLALDHLAEEVEEEEAAKASVVAHSPPAANGADHTTNGSPSAAVGNTAASSSAGEKVADADSSA